MTISQGLGRQGGGWLHVLAIEDNADDVELIRLALRDFERTVDWSVADDDAGVVDALAKSPDLILCDYDLPSLSPEIVLDMLKQRSLGTPLIVVTRAIGEDAVVKLLRNGARDYVAKDKLAMLPQVIERVLEQEAARQRERQMHTELRAAHERLRELSSRTFHVQELERQRLARALHDGLGQTLSAVHMLLEAASREGDPDRARELRSEAHDRVHESIMAVKDLSFEMRSPQLDVLGLPAAVRSVASRTIGPGGPKFELRIFGDERWVPLAKAAVALAIVREAMTNAMRHARAGSITVRLRMQETGQVTMLYADDGIGFDCRAVLQARNPRGRLGLTGMMERCELAGGRLALRSTPGVGTWLRVSL